MAVQLRPRPPVSGYFFNPPTFSFRIQKFPHPHAREFVADFLNATRESGFKNNCIRWMRIDGSCIRKEKVADSKLREDEYMWAGP